MRRMIATSVACDYFDYIDLEVHAVVTGQGEKRPIDAVLPWLLRDCGVEVKLESYYGYHATDTRHPFFDPSHPGAFRRLPRRNSVGDEGAYEKKELGDAWAKREKLQKKNGVGGPTARSAAGRTGSTRPSTLGENRTEKSKEPPSPRAEGDRHTMADSILDTRFSVYQLDEHDDPTNTAVLDATQTDVYEAVLDATQTDVYEAVLDATQTDVYDQVAGGLKPEHLSCVNDPHFRSHRTNMVRDDPPYDSEDHPFGTISTQNRTTARTTCTLSRYHAPMELSDKELAEEVGCHRCGLLYGPVGEDHWR